MEENVIKTATTRRKRIILTFKPQKDREIQISDTNQRECLKYSWVQFYWSFYLTHSAAEALVIQDTTNAVVINNI